jgi:hypothetical protein
LVVTLVSPYHTRADVPVLNFHTPSWYQIAKLGIEYDVEASACCDDTEIAPSGEEK